LAILSSKASFWFYSERLNLVGYSLNYDCERSEVGAIHELPLGDCDVAVLLA
jgi:hypothetical protein